MNRLCLLQPRRSLSLSSALAGGQKTKRRKQNLRADNFHLPVRAVVKTDTAVALTHFDQYYAQYFGKQWAAMRLGLLSRQKYCAVVNNFGDSEATCDQLTELGCINVTQEVRVRQAQQEARGPTEAQRALEAAKVTTTEGDSVTAAEEEVNTIEETKVDPAIYSLDPSQARKRFIDPNERILGNDESIAMYDYIPTSSLKGMEDFVEESDYYKYYEKLEEKSHAIELCHVINFPKHVNVFTFPRGVLDWFPPPRPGQFGGPTNYYCMDAGSLLPVLALDLQPGHAVLDMCAGPGGKSLLALQTLYPGSLVCNDLSGVRLGRVGSVVEQFCGPGEGVSGVRASIRFSRRDARSLLDYGIYDRVICDVPCFSDRHAVYTETDNIFAKKMLKDRLQLPVEQCELLKAGLQYLKTGGCLVYSTCTLSPVQNEGVVNMALKSLWEETSQRFVVSDLTAALRPFQWLFKILGPKEGIKLGNLVVPNLINNFGPTYLCKITRK